MRKLYRLTNFVPMQEEIQRLGAENKELRDALRLILLDWNERHLHKIYEGGRLEVARARIYKAKNALATLAANDD